VTSTIVGTIQEIVRDELRRVYLPELGVVDAVFPHSDAGDDDNYSCDVRLKNSQLLLRRVPIASGHIGSVIIPHVGDLVVVVFEGGDVNQPIVIGRLYDDVDRPPLNRVGEGIFRMPLAEVDSRTIKGAVRNIPSNSPPREILVEMPPKITVRITDGTVRATAGKTELKLDQPDGSGGKVTVVAGRTTITMNQDGDVTVEAAGSMTLQATGNLSLRGRNVEVTSDLATSIKAGTQGEFVCGTTATLQGGVSATVQGALVSVKGITSFSP
jgi:phage baseplate assembly protein gpV